MFLTYIIKIMIINDHIRDEKMEYDINREAADISALSSGQVRKYEYVTGDDILPSNQQQIIEQVLFLLIIEQTNLLILLWEKLLKNK